MPMMFNSVLTEAGRSLADVRLVRHKDNRATRGRTPYELWRDNRPQFEFYQSTQNIRNRTKLTAPYWAVFIANFSNDTMFAGLYGVRYRGLLERDSPMPQIVGGIDKAGSCDVFDMTLSDALSDLIGKLFIDWGGWGACVHPIRRPQQQTHHGVANRIQRGRLSRLPQLH